MKISEFIRDTCHTQGIISVLHDKKSIKIANAILYSYSENSNFTILKYDNKIYPYGVDYNKNYIILVDTEELRYSISYQSDIILTVINNVIKIYKNRYGTNQGELVNDLEKYFRLEKINYLRNKYGINK